MKLFAPCFILRWTEEIPAIGEIQDGNLKIVSPPASKRFIVISPVVECEIRQGERFLAPQALIPDEWREIIIVPNSLRPYKAVKSVCVQTWTSPDTLRHLFPNLQPLMYSHWLLLPYNRPSGDVETSCYDTEMGRIFFVYRPDRTEYEKRIAATEERACIIAIESAFADTKSKSKKEGEK